MVAVVNCKDQSCLIDCPAIAQQCDVGGCDGECTIVGEPIRSFGIGRREVGNLSVLSAKSPRSAPR